MLPSQITMVASDESLLGAWLNFGSHIAYRTNVQYNAKRNREFPFSAAEVDAVW